MLERSENSTKWLAIYQKQYLQYIESGMKLEFIYLDNILILLLI